MFMKNLKNKCRRGLAVILSLVMCLGMLTVPAFAAEGEVLEPSEMEEDGQAAVCTRDDTCEAETHEEGCPMYEAPVIEDEEQDSTVCTGDENCTAETHEEGCPKAVPPVIEDEEQDSAACTGDENCTAETHEEGCPMYETPVIEDEEQDSTVCTMDESCTAEVHEEGCPLKAEEEEILPRGRARQFGDELEVTLEETGTLQALVESTEGYDPLDVISLVIFTEDGAALNSEDFAYLRTELVNLETLDLSGADCVDDTDPEEVVEGQIPAGAMEGTDIVELILPQEGTNVDAIGQKAFYDCCYLEAALTIPGNIRTVGKQAFAASSGTYCTQLEGLTIESGVVEIGTQAFFVRPILGGLTIPNTVERIGFEAFKMCIFDGELAYEENSSVSKLEWNAFYGCSGFTGSITFPDTPDLTVSGGTYALCTGFTGDIVIPDNIVVLGNQTFYGCTGLNGSLIIGSGVERIDATTFSYSGPMTGTLDLSRATNLKVLNDCAKPLSGKLELPEQLEEIGDYVFSGSNFSGELVLPEGLKKIGNSAFANMPNITGELKLPAGLESLGAAFLGTKGLTGDIVIPEGITKIPKQCFYDCSGLSGKLVMSENVTEIADMAFGGTGELTLDHFPARLETLGSSNHLVVDAVDADGVLRIPASITTLGGWSIAFSKIPNLKKIEYHGGGAITLNSIGSTIIEEVDISNSGTKSLTVNAWSSNFRTVNLTGCSGLEEINITYCGLETIDLTDCTNLKKATLNNNAIDFSAGRPAEWLKSFTGTKNIKPQTLKLYPERGPEHVELNVGGTYEDGYKILTRNGTDVTTYEKWKEFYELNKDWVNTIHESHFAVTRSLKDVDTSKPGEQVITYSTGATYLKDVLNYSVYLTVGEGFQSVSKITVKNPKGQTINASNGYAVTYGWAPFALTAELAGEPVTSPAAPFAMRRSAPRRTVIWHVYTAQDCQVASSDVLSVEGSTFTIEGVGEAWVTAQIGNVISAPVKIVVNKAAYSVNLNDAKSKSYGSADTAALGYRLIGQYGKTVQGVTFTREPGEDVGKYQVWMYDFETLGIENKPGEEGFDEAYTVACVQKFEDENPNYKLNLTLPKDKDTGNFEIKPLGLNVAITLKDKTYDAQTATGLNINWGTLDKYSKQVTVTMEAAFNSADVNRNEAGAVIAQTGHATITLQGEVLKNYALPGGFTSGTEKDGVTWTVSEDGMTVILTKKNLSAKINPVSLTLKVGPMVKTYDGETGITPANPIGEDKWTVSGLKGQDQQEASSLRFAFENANAGTGKPIKLSSDKITLSNYTVPALKGDITPAPLYVTGLTAANKVYDGTKAAVVSGTPVLENAPEGVALAENLQVNGSFYTADAGENLSVAAVFGKDSLTGENAGNYVLRSKALSADITPATLTVSTGRGEKVYNGTPLTNSECTVTGQVNGETVTGAATGSQTEVGSSVNTYALTWGTAKESNYRIVENLGTLTVTEPAHEHSHEETITAPTCTEQGYTTHTCACGDSYRDTYVDPLGHDFAEAWNHDAANHWHVCTRCNMPSDAAGHTETSEITLRPTYTRKGERTYTCTVCGATRTESIDRLPYEPSYPSGGGNSSSGGSTGGTTTNPSTPTTTIPDDPTPLDPGVTIGDQDVPLTGITFEDVTPGDWFYEAVQYVYGKDLMKGTSETQFSPYASTQRGMIVTILHRLEGMPAAEAPAFADVEAGQWYANAVGWGSANGVVEGYSASEFAPLRNITREQLAAILYRYAQLKGYDTSKRADLSGYSDASAISAYALEAMRWAVAEGLIAGKTETTLAPGGEATRAEAAMILMRFCETIAAAPAANETQGLLDGI